MTQSGGSATTYGILYQALGAIHWASTISLRATLDNDQIESAHLTIEPRGGGGDIVIDAEGHQIVEQWKAKSDHGTWSVRSLVTEVFPDLYRSVKQPLNPAPVEYRFISEGRAGRWRALSQLLSKVKKSTQPPEDPMSVLDHEQRLSYLSDSKMTEREFFSWVFDTLRSEHADIRSEDRDHCLQKLWHLMAHFSFVGQRTMEKVQAELDQLLLGAVDYREQVDNKRRELNGLVLELAGQGEVALPVGEFLDLADIRIETFGKWSKLQERMRREISHRTRVEWHYTKELDVRPTPTWECDRPVLVLSGESGQGKTWQLAALALNVARTSGLVSTVTATGDVGRDLQAASNLIWQTMLLHDRELSLDRLAERRSEVAPAVGIPWLTVLVDDVLSIDEARRLVSQDWRRFGARLAMTTLPAIARGLKSQFRETVEVVNVRDFNVLEAQEFVRRCGHDWGRLPHDVRETLKRPLLAGLFAELAAEDERWHPRYEYELFERFWLRIRDARDQADHPGDASWVRLLVGTVFDESRPYPWAQSSLVNLGLPEDVQRRLESIGWLRRLDGDRVEVWHDRVLNWAVAEELVARLELGTYSVELLSDAIADLCDTLSMRNGRHLGYVPLDVLWIIGDPIRGLRENMPRLLEAIENAPGGYHDLELLYRDLLPGLGERVIGCIVERVRNTPKGDGNRYPYLAASAIEKIAKSNHQSGRSSGLDLLNESDDDLRQVGMQVLAACPNPAAIDRLWELHEVHCRSKDTDEFRAWWPKYDASFTALRTAVRQNPAWLESKIASASASQSSVHELVYLLASIEGEVGRRLWVGNKQNLFAVVPEEKSRCLARCIEQYRDLSEVGRLRKWLAITTDSLSSTAFAALVRIDPKQAVECLNDVEPFELYVSRGWWLAQLTARCPDQTQSVLRNRISREPDNRWILARVYEGMQHLMDEATLRLLLSELEDLLNAFVNGSNETGIDVQVPLMLLQDVTSPRLLNVFEAYRGSQFERCLVEAAKLRIDRQGLFVDHIQEGLRSLLLRIGGNGITALVNAELQSTNKHSRRGGVENCLINPDGETRKRLREQTYYEELWNENGFPLVQTEAAVRLAALGENASIIENVLRWKGGVFQELSDVRRRMPPMSDADLAEAITAISSREQERRVQGFWALSISGRSDLVELAVDTLRSAEPDSELARSAAWAIANLGCQTADVASLIEPQLDIGTHKYGAILALLKINSSEALSILENCLMHSGITPGNMNDLILADSLVRRPASRSAVTSLVWKSLQEHPLWGLSPKLYECLTDLPAEEVKEWLVAQAYAPRGLIHTVGQRASFIRTLAKLDSNIASQICESALATETTDILELAKVLIELGAEYAVPVLCQIAVQGVAASTRYSIALGLRQVTDKEFIRKTLAMMQASVSAHDRKVSIELAGWIGPEALNFETVQASLDDHALAVRTTASKALSRYAIEVDSRQLLAQFKQSSGPKAWSILDAVLDSADPNALQTRGDPLFLADAYPDDNVPYWLYCETPLKRRRNELERELRRMDEKEE